MKLTFLILIISMFLTINCDKITNINQICSPLNRQLFQNTITGEQIEWDVALQTTSRESTLQSYKKSILTNDLYHNQNSPEIHINQSRNMPSFNKLEQVKVTKTSTVQQLLTELESIRDLSKKSFTQKFYGCQFDPEHSDVYIVQQAIDKNPNLEKSSEIEYFQKHSLKVRVNFYIKLFQAVHDISEAGFVHGGIELKYVTVDLELLTPILTNFQNVLHINDFVQNYGNTLYWSPNRHTFNAKTLPKDDLFALAVLIIQLENRKKDDIFEHSSGDFVLFSFSNSRHMKLFVDSAIESLELAGFGKAVFDKTRKEWEENNLAGLLLSIIQYSKFRHSVLETVELVEILAQKSLDDEWDHNFEKAKKESGLVNKEELKEEDLFMI